MGRSRDLRSTRVLARREAARPALRFVVRAVLAFMTLVLASRDAWAQVGTIATSAPALSPVGLWGSTGAEGGPVAQANTLTIRINSGATQSIASLRDNHINFFPSSVNITTEWQLANLITAVDLVGYFSNPSAALATAGATLPSSMVKGRMVSGGVSAYTAFTQNALNSVGTPGGSLHLFRQFIIVPINGIGRRTDNLDLQLDLRGVPSIPAGTYRGTLTLRAIAY